MDQQGRKLENTRRVTRTAAGADVATPLSLGLGEERLGDAGRGPTRPRRGRNPRSLLRIHDFLDRISSWFIAVQSHCVENDDVKKMNVQMSHSLRRRGRTESCSARRGRFSALLLLSVWSTSARCHDQLLQACFVRRVRRGSSRSVPFPVASAHSFPLCPDGFLSGTGPREEDGRKLGAARLLCRQILTELRAAKHRRDHRRLRPTF